MTDLHKQYELAKNTGRKQERVTSVVHAAQRDTQSWLALAAHWTKNQKDKQRQFNTQHSTLAFYWGGVQKLFMTCNREADVLQFNSSKYQTEILPIALVWIHQTVVWSLVSVQGYNNAAFMQHVLKICRWSRSKPDIRHRNDADSRSHQRKLQCCAIFYQSPVFTHVVNTWPTRQKETALISNESTCIGNNYCFLSTLSVTRHG